MRAWELVHQQNDRIAYIMTQYGIVNLKNNLMKLWNIEEKEAKNLIFKARERLYTEVIYQPKDDMRYPLVIALKEIVKNGKAYEQLSAIKQLRDMFDLGEPKTNVIFEEESIEDAEWHSVDDMEQQIKQRLEEVHGSQEESSSKDEEV